MIFAGKYVGFRRSQDHAPHSAGPCKKSITCPACTRGITTSTKCHEEQVLVFLEHELKFHAISLATASAAAVAGQKMAKYFSRDQVSCQEQELQKSHENKRQSLRACSSSTADFDPRSLQQPTAQRNAACWDTPSAPLTDLSPSCSTRSNSSP